MSSGLEFKGKGFEFGSWESLTPECHFFLLFHLCLFTSAIITAPFLPKIFLYTYFYIADLSTVTWSVDYYMTRLVRVT